MRRERLVIRFIVFFIVFLSFSTERSFSQHLLKGRVVNELTNEGVTGASVILSSDIGTSTDSLGYFTLTINQTLPVRLTIHAMGFQDLSKTINKLSDNIILLEESNNVIETIEISRKRKYNNRNPAVDLIDQVIKYKSQNRLSGIDRIQFDQYNKMKFGLVNPQPFLANRLGKLNFFFENLDTTTLADRKVLTIYQEENLAKAYSQRNPSKHKKIIYSQQKTEFDNRYINNANIESFIDFLFQEVDIYDESIFLINKLLLSPIANNGKLYYKYYIIDTLLKDNVPSIQLAFEPRNPEDLLFRGTLNISMDGRFAVKDASLELDKKANINWVNELELNLKYRPNASGAMLLHTSGIKVLFGVGNNDRVFGERQAFNSNYDLQSVIPDQVFQGAPLAYQVEQQQSYDAFKRPVALSTTELKTYQNVDSLNNIKSFSRLLSIGYLVTQGYTNLGPIELGPLEYMFSTNELEGNRFRIGGRSTTALSEKVFMEGYLAYGTRDQQLKYFLRSAISLNGKSVATFPAHYVEGMIQSDVFEPGKGLGFLKGDGFFLSFRKNKPFKFLDTDAYRLRHVVEFGNHISLTTGYTHQRRLAAGTLRMLSSDATNTDIGPIITNDAHLILRWAPNEKFYYRNLTRSTIIEKYPVFTLQYNKGFTGLWGANYEYDALRGMVSKRLFLNQLGFADITATGGKIWGTLSYPLLEMPNVRDEFNRHEVRFDLMNSMEFAADQFVKFSFVHQAQGFLFNKIPLLKKLRWREIWGAQMFYGKLSDHNNPYLSNKVILFDRDEEGETFTQVIGKNPYWEASAGIDNILNLFRVEYIRRLNYNHLPDVNKDRFRISLNVYF